MRKRNFIGISVAALFFLAGCQSNTTDTDTVSSNSSVALATNTSSTTAASSHATQSAVNDKIKVNLSEAIQKYQKTYSDTSITGIDLDTSFGTYYYEIQGVDDNKEYEVKINAVDGSLTKEREETLDSEEQNGVKKQEDALSLDNLMNLADISAAAEKAAGKGTADEWSLDKEMSISYWEVKVQDGTTSYEIKVNAETGAILETETDD